MCANNKCGSTVLSGTRRDNFEKAGEGIFGQQYLNTEHNVWSQTKSLL